MPARAALARAFVRAGKTAEAMQLLMAITTRWRHMDSPIVMLIASQLAVNQTAEAMHTLNNASWVEGPLWNARYLLALHLAKQGRKSGGRSPNAPRPARSGQNNHNGTMSRGLTAEMYVVAKNFSRAQRYALQIDHDFIDRTRTLVDIAEHARQIVRAPNPCTGMAHGAERLSRPP